MPAPGVTIQLIQRRNDPRSHRIQMDVSNQGQKVRLLVAQYRLIPIFKKMTRPAVPPVEVLSKPRQKPAHGCQELGNVCNNVI